MTVNVISRVCSVPNPNQIPTLRELSSARGVHETNPARIIRNALASGLAPGSSLAGRIS